MISPLEKNNIPSNISGSFHWFSGKLSKWIYWNLSVILIFVELFWHKLILFLLLQNP